MIINNTYKIFAAVATFAACLASCSQEDFPINEPGGSQPLAITVTDGGYVSETPTRATEDDYRTEFTAGDACGLYVIDGGKTIVSNLKITATDVDGSTQWKTEEGTNIYVDNAADASYFLYYPYQAEGMDGKTDSSASDDAGFFAPLISDWQPQADQSDYVDGYTVSDLMTATGTISDNGITFSMTHRMALAVIDLPGTIYKFTDSSIPDYAVHSTAEFTSDTKPCRMTDGTYRYIVNPDATASAITGTYADGKKEFSLTPSGLTTSTYKTYRVDDGSSASVERAYTLQAGDFFCSNADGNGWYIIPKDLAPTEADNCIGIVFRTGKDDSDQSDYRTPLITGGPTLGETVHGYVVALTDVHAGGIDRLRWEYGPNNEYKRSVGTSTASDDWNGYDNCWKIHEFVVDNSSDGWDMKHFPAALACETYGNRTLDWNGNPITDQYNWQQPFVAPANTSGWFLPSCGQLLYLCDNSDFLSSQISKVKEHMSNTESKNYVKWFSTSWYYWSSSEYSGSDAWYVYFNDGYTSTYYKDYTRDVRAVLAF